MAALHFRPNHEGRLNDRVHGIHFAYDCKLGFHANERHIRQRVLVDFEAETDFREAARTDQPSGALVDYYKVNNALRELVEAREWNLVETMAEDIARLLCTRFPVSRVRVKVTKSPFDMPNAGAVAVECQRSREDFLEEQAQG